MAGLRALFTRLRARLAVKRAASPWFDGDLRTHRLTVGATYPGPDDPKISFDLDAARQHRLVMASTCASSGKPPAPLPGVNKRLVLTTEGPRETLMIFRGPADGVGNTGNEER